MRRWLPCLVAVNGLVVLINLAMTAYGALAHRWTALLSLVGAAVGEAAIVYIIHAHRRTKPSSPSQQPTSSTSLNQSPFASLNLPPSPSGSSPQSPSPSEPSRSKFQPEKRSVPVVGFRAWRVSEGFKLGVGPTGEMGAINASYGNWHPGVNVARCFAMIYDYATFTTSMSLRVGVAAPASLPTHSAPNPECSCGFYVLSNLDAVPYRWHYPGGVEQGVVGAVVGWGRVVQHGDEGWRAEKVQVIAFLDCKLSAEHLARTERMAEAYGVPVVGRKALELLAAEYGERLK